MLWLVALLALVLVSGAKAPSSDEPTTEPDMSKGSRKQFLYGLLRSLPQLTEDQRLFIMLVAYGETGGTYKPTAHNDTESEVAASAKAWDNNPTLAAKLVNCGAGGRDAWAIGSGGYGGRIVPYFGDDMLDIGGMPCSPQGVFDPLLSIVSTILTAWKLQQNDAWANSAHTVGALRVGYYGPGYMDNPPADRIQKYRKHAEAVGLQRSFVDVVMPPFPGPKQSHAIYAALKAATP